MDTFYFGLMLTDKKGHMKENAWWFHDFFMGGGGGGGVDESSRCSGRYSVVLTKHGEG